MRLQQFVKGGQCANNENGTDDPGFCGSHLTVHIRQLRFDLFQAFINGDQSLINTPIFVRKIYETAI